MHRELAPVHVIARCALIASLMACARKDDGWPHTVEEFLGPDTMQILSSPWKVETFRIRLREPSDNVPGEKNEGFPVIATGRTMDAAFGLGSLHVTEPRWVVAFPVCVRTVAWQWPDDCAKMRSPACSAGSRTI
jgi:hypothetical protein